MNRVSKGVAWMCIPGVLSTMGCYTSELIEPKTADWEKVPWGKIECVVTKDSTKYVFDVPPVVVEDTIVGQIPEKVEENRCVEITLPVSEVAQFGGRLSGEITYVIMKTGEKYTFEEPPTFIDKSIVGKIEDPGEYSDADTRILIPLSTVAYVSLRSEENPGLQSFALATLSLALSYALVWAAFHDL